jgi:hypothetical protein
MDEFVHLEKLTNKILTRKYLNKMEFFLNVEEFFSEKVIFLFM